MQGWRRPLQQPARASRATAGGELTAWPGNGPACRLPRNKTQVAPLTCIPCSWLPSAAAATSPPPAPPPAASPVDAPLLPASSKPPAAASAGSLGSPRGLPHSRRKRPGSMCRPSMMMDLPSRMHCAWPGGGEWRGRRVCDRRTSCREGGTGSLLACGTAPKERLALPLATSPHPVTVSHRAHPPTPTPSHYGLPC